MNKLYKGYDSITASDAFKQRMVRTLQSEVREEAAEDHKVVRLPVKRKTIAILIAAAVLVLTIGTAVAAEMDVVPLPKVFSTVIEFIKKGLEPPTSTSPREYMSLSKEEREEIGFIIPDIEEAIEEAKPESVDYSIEMLPEMKIVNASNALNFIREKCPREYELLEKTNITDDENAYRRMLREAGYVLLYGMNSTDDVNAYRQKKGQPAYSEEEWGWIRELRPEVEEVLVDGKQWSINIRLNTDHHGKCFSTDWEGDVYTGRAQRVAVVCRDAYYTLESTGETVYLPKYSTGVTENSITKDGCTLYTLWEKYGFNQYAEGAENNDDQAEGSFNVFPTEGKTRLTLEFAILDAKVSRFDDGAILGIIQYTFDFDASAGKAAGNTIVTDRWLSGSVVMTMVPSDYGRRYNQRVSLDGVVLEETMEYQKTGIVVQYAVKSGPEGWTEDHTRSLIEGLYVELMPKDGIGVSNKLEPDTFLSRESDLVYSGILPIFPSEYDTIREMGYMVRIRLEAVNYVDGKTVGEDWVMEKDPEGWTYHGNGCYTFHYADGNNDDSDIRVKYQTIVEHDLQLP